MEGAGPSGRGRSVNKDDKREYEREWRAKNVDHVREYRRQYYADNKDKFQVYRATYHKKRRAKTSLLYESLTSLGNPLAKECAKRKCKYLNENGIPSCDYVIFNGPRPCPAGKDCTVWERMEGKNDRKGISDASGDQPL